MSFPRYPKYKDSGVEWLGEVPEHWDVVALKRIASLKSGDGITGDTIEESGEYPVLGGNGLRGYTSAFTHDGHFVVIGRQGALCGNINYATGSFGRPSMRWSLRRYSTSRPFGWVRCCGQ